jgi:hypothetical protein
MSGQPDVVLPKRRRFLQFSLGTLLLAVTLPGVWLGLEVNKARRQREAIAAIERLGGAVLYDYQFDAKHTQIADAKSNVPQWFRGGFGEEFYRKPVQIYMGGLKLKAGDLRPLESLTELDWLYLGSCTLPDAELVHLKPLKKLRSLDLGGTPISDAGLAQLASLKRLEWLDLGTTEVSDAGVETLKQLPRLNEVFVYQTKITDRGKSALKAKLPNCKIDRQ